MNLESKKSKIIDWTGIPQLLEVKTEPLVCFKIIPDRSITNYSNYKFFKDVSELDKLSTLKENLKIIGKYSKSLFKREERDEFKLVYLPQTNYVWYEIVIKEKEINFYIICYESNSNFVKGKLEQVFPNAPIDYAPIQETWIPEENTLIADLKLQRHNFFSIYTNYQEQAQPIEDILATAEDVKENDILKFSLRVQPYDRNYWSYKAEEWEASVRKGKPPKRIRVTKTGILNGIFGISEFAFQKLGDLFREIHEIAFKKPQKHIIVNHTSQESREIGGISRQTSYKMTAPVFRTTMRVASHSNDFTRRVMNLKSMSNSFIDVKDTNNSIVRTAIYEKPDLLSESDKKTLLDRLLKREQKPKKESKSIEEWHWKNVYNEVSSQKVTMATHMDIDYNIMCDKELGKIQMLPTAKVQREHSSKMKSLGRVENPVPKEYRDESGIPIGYAEFKGKKFNIFIPDNNPDTWSLPIIASGMQGVGKDTIGINWVLENNKRGRSAVILDVIDERERGMTDVLIEVIEPKNLIVLDYANPDVTPYLDWKEGMKTENRFTKNRLANELSKFFESSDDGAGLQTERYLRNCIKALPNESLIEQSMILISEQIRNKAIKECEKRNDISTANFWKSYDTESEARKKQISAPVFNRLSKLIDDLALKPIFGQKPNGSIDFDKWTAEGKVIICRIPKVAFGTNGIRTLVHWLSVKTWLTKQVQLHEGRKCETILLLNEIHQFMDKGLENTLREMYPEARKHGLQIMTLFHDIVQIPRDLFETMLSSGANFMLYKQKTDKAWKRFGERITENFEIEECMKLNKFEAIIGFLVGIEDLPVIRVKMNDMPIKRGCETYDNKETIEICLREFHRPINEVEQEVLTLEEKMFSKKVKSR